MLSKIDVKRSLQKIIFHFSVEEMRDKENQAKPQNSNNKFANQFENHFNFFRVVTPKPTFHFVRERTTADIVSADTHKIQPLALFLDYIIL